MRCADRRESPKCFSPGPDEQDQRIEQAPAGEEREEDAARAMNNEGPLPDFAEKQMRKKPRNQKEDLHPKTVADMLEEIESAVCPVIDDSPG